jgi:hypothetical protein
MSRALLLAPLSLLVVACGGSDRELVGTKSSISVGLQTIDFGGVPAGATKTIEVPVSNVGDSVLNVCVADDNGMQTTHDVTRRCAGLTRVVPDDGSFRPGFDGVDPNTGMWPVAVGQDGARARKFSVEFTPAAISDFKATLYLVDDYMTRTTPLTIQGSGRQPNITVSPDKLDFGEVLVGEWHRLTVTVTNNDTFDQPYQIDPVSGDANGFFYLTQTGSNVIADRPIKGSLAAQGTMSVDVWYNPTFQHEDTVALTVGYCPVCAKTLAIHGISTSDETSAGGGGSERGHPEPSNTPNEGHTPIPPGSHGPS